MKDNKKDNKKGKKMFTYGGISYPINPKKSKFIPEIENFLEDSLDEKTIKGVLASICIDKPVLLEGPTGVGKTILVRWLANKTNNPYRRIQLNGSTTIDNFVGSMLLNSKGTYWEDGILTDAMRKGHFLLLDELNAALPEILFILNSILDDDKCLILDGKDDREIVKPHPNFRLFAAMNPWQDYAGTKELNRAQMDRFTVIQYDYPNDLNEEKIVSKHSNISVSLGKLDTEGRSVIKRMVELANIIRKKNKDTLISSVCSTRQLIQWAQLCEHLDIKHAAELTVINKCDNGEKKLIQDELNKLFRNGETIQEHELNKKKFNSEKKKVVVIEDDNLNIENNAVIDAEVLKARKIATQSLNRLNSYI